MTESPRPSAVITRRMIVFAVALIVLLALAAGGTWYWWVHRDPAKRFAAIVQLLDSRKLVATDPNGNAVALPSDLSDLTPRGVVHIRPLSDGGQAMLIPTFYNQADRVSGYLYCSRSLPEQDTYTMAAHKMAQPMIDIGSARHLFIIDRLNPHWFRVSNLYY